MRGHYFKYNREITLHIHLANFIFNQSANLWNSLPNQFVNAETVKRFEHFSTYLKTMLTKKKATLLSSYFEKSRFRSRY